MEQQYEYGIGATFKGEPHITGMSLQEANDWTAEWYALSTTEEQKRLFYIIRRPVSEWTRV